MQGISPLIYVRAYSSQGKLRYNIACRRTQGRILSGDTCMYSAIVNPGFYRATRNSGPNSSQLNTQISPSLWGKYLVPILQSSIFQA